MKHLGIPDRKTIVWKMEGENACVQVGLKKYILNKTCSIVWKEIDGASTSEDIVSKIQYKYDVKNGREDLIKVVDKSLDILLKKKLITLKANEGIDGWLNYE